MNINDLQQIISILKQNEVTEFELDQEGTKVSIKRLGAGMQVVQGPLSISAPVGSHAPAAASAPALVETAAIPAHYIKVESPIVGMFYRRPSPDAEPFVREGERVRKGQKICIIEAMKVMNEIDSPVDGKVEKILLNDGHVVEFGELLFIVNPE